MKVVLVEDDYYQAEEVVEALRSAWPRIEVERVGTESEFRRRLRDFSADPPNVFIIDVMLAWAYPDPEMEEAPPEVVEEKHYRAGLRCANLLRQHAGTSDAPIILYSALSRIEVVGDRLLPPDVVFLEKESNMGRLIRLVGSFTAAQVPTKEPSATLRDVFICHASEDKVSVVEPIVEALESAGITFWYDRAELRWGDSLISKVEEGLRISRYVLAVLSKHFLRNPWPRRELNAALNIEATTGEVKVLPLVVGSEKEIGEILRECALQNDKLYEVWAGSPSPVVRRLKERLK